MKRILVPGLLAAAASLWFPGCATPEPSASRRGNYLAGDGGEPQSAQNAEMLENINTKGEEMRFLRARVQDLEKENAALQAENTKKQADLDTINQAHADRGHQITTLDDQVAELSQKLAKQREAMGELQDLLLAEKISRLRAERQLLEMKLGSEH